MVTWREGSNGHDAGVPAHGGPRASIRLSRRSRSHLLTVAVVTVLGAVIGAANAWLLSRVVPFDYDFAEFENGLRNGAMIGASLIALELFYVQEPRELGSGARASPSASSTAPLCTPS